MDAEPGPRAPAGVEPAIRANTGVAPAIRAHAGAVLDIDLGAIVANWRQLCARHAGPVAGVLKADAYGMGAPHVARGLYAAGCRHFFTAHVHEAMVLRPLVGEAMLSALSGLPPGEEAACVAAGIDPVLCSLDDIARWRAHARRLGRPLPALLHIDTGMSRLGLDGGEFRALREDPGRLDGVALRYVMTHLAAADDPADPLNRAQLARFTAACAALPPAPRSLANSSGIFLGPDWGSDLARPGGALYGLNPTPADDNPMRQTARLRARVVQVREIGSGEGVGYGATWRAARPSRIATVGVGYADGYPRALSNRGWACFDGATVPLVGRVSMDLTTFDATGMPTLRAGDWLELLGPGATADALGAAAGSNGYEILTSLGGRITRSWRG